MYVDVDVYANKYVDVDVDELERKLGEGRLTQSSAMGLITTWDNQSV